MKQFVFSLVLVFSMGTLFAQSAAETAAALDENIVKRPCPDNRGKCFYRKEKLDERKVIFTLVEYNTAEGKFIEPANSSNQENITSPVYFKIIEESNKNVEPKRKTKEKPLKARKEKRENNRAVKGFDTKTKN